MQIGTRWPVGGEVPAKLPAPFVEAVRDVERDQQLTGGMWTLTWLEGRPVAEHPEGVRLALQADGTVSVGSLAALEEIEGAEDEDDDWLS